MSHASHHPFAQATRRSGPDRAVCRRRQQRAAARAARLCEFLEPRRLLHAFIDGIDLVMVDINGAANDTFIVNYIPATFSVQMIHQGAADHPGHTTPLASFAGKIIVRTDPAAGDDGITINGTGGRDVLIQPAEGADTIVINGTEGGDVTVESGAGNDVITVNDTRPGQTSGGGSVDVFAGAGNDAVTINRNNGGDVNVWGEADADTLTSAATIDSPITLRGGTGDDTINISSKGEHVFAGDGSDTINGGAGPGGATIFGDEGPDSITGGSGAEWLFGDAGNDTITGGGGSDWMTGDADDDLLKAASDGSVDTVDGGAGNDTADVDPFDILSPPGTVENLNVIISPDAFEPNDSFATATNLGVLGDRTENNLTLHAAADGDYFRFVAETSGLLDVSIIKNDPSAGAIVIDVFNASQVKLHPNTSESSRSVPVQSGATYYLHVFSGAGSPTANYTLNIDAPNRPDSVYVSDLIPLSAVNGWGPWQRDRSNGEAGANDGHPLRLDGIVYPKGIGVHAASKLVYNLGGEYNRFTAAIGVDDEVGNNGSVVFELVADGAVIYTSGPMTGASPTQFVDKPLVGVSKLQLIVRDGGNGIGFDHADWADAKLYPETTPPPPPPTGPAVFVSDLDPISQTNGWGPYERDRSNGEQGAADGKPIRLVGSVKSYDRGLGVHANSSLIYNVAGMGFKTFVASIGVDVEVGNKGSVVFQVLGDGTPMYTSGIMRGGQASLHIAVNIAGYNQITLSVLNGGDNTFYDHADWANAQFRTDSLPPPPPPPTGDIYLSDLTPVSQTNGWGPYERDRSNGETGAADGRALIIAGKKYNRGLGAHANSDLRYDLSGLYKTFSASVGVDDEVGSNGSVIFEVWGDGALLATTGVLTGADPAAESFLVPVSGVHQLWLRVRSAGDGNAYDHADWGDAKLMK